MIAAIHEIFRYRELVARLVEKELKLRYKRSFLGIVWTMLNPFLIMVILSVVFSHIMRVRVENFPVFLLSAILPWNFASQAILGASQSIVNNESLIKKVYVPRAVFPLSMVGSHLVNLLFALVPLFAIMLLQGVPIKASALAIIPATLALCLFVLGVSLALSALTVFFRDLTHIVEVVLTAWFYLTPIVYPADLIPPKYAAFFALNPLLYLLAPFRTALYGGVFPDARTFLTVFAIALASVLLGFLIFRSREREFVIYLS